MASPTHRIAQGLAALALAAGAVLALSSPAQANVLACMDHVRANTSLPVGDRVRAACEAGEGWAGDHAKCVDQLTSAGIGSGVADTACRQAALG